MFSKSSCCCSRRLYLVPTRSAATTESVLVGTVHLWLFVLLLHVRRSEALSLEIDVGLAVAYRAQHDSDEEVRHQGIQDPIDHDQETRLPKIEVEKIHEPGHPDRQR